MISAQIPRPPQPSEAAVLSASNLELLSTSHEKNRVQEFVASQSRYAKARVNDGRAVHASWDISTPEKDRMRLHQLSAGFETPVLRPRAAQTQSKPNELLASSSRLKSPVNKPTSQSPALIKKAKATPAVREPVSPKRKGPGKKSTAKKSGTSDPTRKERHARSDTDEEHLARLTERRERKRARREIMDPREDRAGTRDEKENKKDAKNDKKKQRIPAGLALMHGFSSASVGKSRLTIEPPPNFGVFNKGKASAKIKVDESKRTKQRGFPSRIFSEDRFLDTRPAKSSEERLDTQTSSGRNSSNERSSPVKMKKSAAAQLKKTPIKIKGTTGRCQRATSMQCDSDTANSYTSRTVDMREAVPTDQAEPMQSRSPARSISWVIEQDDLSLPSTTSDVAVASIKSKPETALLDVRAAAWSKILQNGLPGEKALYTSELHKNLQTISNVPATAILQKVTSNAHVEVEELATIGPWESASQVARSTLPPREQRSVHSRYFALPHGGESGFAQRIMDLANDPLRQPVGIDGACSNDAEDMTMDGPLVHEEAGVDHQGGDAVPPFASGNVPSDDKAFAFPEERISANQTSSLDSVDRALLPDVPWVTRRRSRVRRRPVSSQEFNPTLENILFQQYGLDPTDSHFEASRPSLYDHDDSQPVDAGNSLGDWITLGIKQDNALSFREVNTEGLEGDGEDQGWRSDWCPDIISDSHEFASDIMYGQPDVSYDCQDGTPLFLGEQDTGYEGVNETEEDCTGFASGSIPSTNWSGFMGEDADETNSIHLWNDEALARGDTAGGNALQEGYSHLTTVQKVEQDVAKKLKGHWFPHKF